MMNTGEPQSVPRPVFKVISGNASAEEVAAVVAVLSAAATARAATASRPRRAQGVRTWADRSAMLRKPLRPGPDGWRASARPS